MNKKEQLDSVSSKIRECTHCQLWKNRLKAVPGEGPSDAPLIFIGEAPGKKENKTGRPFVGKSGSLFDDLLTMAGLERNTLFLTSVIKCHPPNNRKPKSDELATCISLWMQEQIEIIDPEYIILLGGVALKSMVGKKGVKANHGNIISHENKKYFVTYHPAAGLRNPKVKERLIEDFNKISDLNQ